MSSDTDPETEQSRLTDRERIIIAGSRSITDYELLRRIMLGRAGKRPMDAPDQYAIVSGTANGVDHLGEQFASKWDIPLRTFPADWDKHGKAAGPIRNREMAEYADTLIALWDGESDGTADMIATALEQDLEVHVFQPEHLTRDE